MGKTLTQKLRDMSQEELMKWISNQTGIAQRGPSVLEFPGVGSRDLKRGSQIQDLKRGLRIYYSRDEELAGDEGKINEKIRGYLRENGLFHPYQGLSPEVKNANAVAALAWEGGLGAGPLRPIRKVARHTGLREPLEKENQRK